MASQWLQPEFVSSIAWPLVALIGLIILGPFGVLTRFARQLGESFGKFSQGYEDLRKLLIKTQSHSDDFEKQLSRMGGNLEQLTSSGEALGKLEERMAGFQLAVGQALEKLDEQMAGFQLAVDQALSDVGRVGGKIIEESKHKNDPEVPDLSEEEATKLYDEVMAAWLEFDAVFRGYVSKTNIQYDGRAVGSIAESLTDGRRGSSVLESELANLIADNFFEIKSMRRTQADKTTFSREYFEEMKSDIDETIQAIRSK